MPPLYDLAVRNGQVVTPNGVIAADLGIRNGVIDAIDNRIGPARTDLDARGQLVLPGGVDVHAHIEQMSGMGVMNADTFETATHSAACGGTTCVVCFAAQAKGQRLRDAVADYQQRAERGAMIDYAFHIIVSDPSVPEFEEDLAALIRDGHRSIKLFTTYDIRLGDAEILRVMSVAKAEGALVCVHAENDAIITRARNALIAQGRLRPSDHAASRPRWAEIEAVERICHFAQYLNQPVMLFHISTREAAAIVARHRAQGAPVWAETCPHYLLMTQDVLDQPEGGKWMCSPPQRTPADQDALWAALAEDDLQIISSDHAPYRYDASGKLAAGPDAGFHQIANGLPGLETRLPLMFDAIVSKGRGTAEDFARLTATAPAALHGLARKGRIAVGADADLVIWSADRQVTYGADDLHDNVGYNPWEGTTVTGWPETVLLRGTVLVDERGFHGRGGAGVWQSRPQLSPHLQEKLK